MRHANGSPEEESPGLSISYPHISYRDQPSLSLGASPVQEATVEREIICKCCCGQAYVLWQPGQGASTQGEGWGEGQPDLSERGYWECLGEHG